LERGASRADPDSHSNRDSDIDAAQVVHPNRHADIDATQVVHPNRNTNFATI
jgi:hypothetical protein